MVEFIDKTVWCEILDARHKTQTCSFPVCAWCGFCVWFFLCLFGGVVLCMCAGGRFVGLGCFLNPTIAESICSGGGVVR